MSTVLYVEDHPPAQLLMRAIIADLTTHRLIVAGTGAEARTFAETDTPDIYIVDLDLPDGDGLTLASALKTIHAAPVLLVSAYGESVNVATLQTVIHAYLAKPLDPIHVAETIQRTLA
jgi:two-component system, OmpR family, response regulator